MNGIHRVICRSALWKFALRRNLIPWAIDGVDLGSNVLEIGPGPGLATDILRDRVPHLTALEVDEGFAASLRERLHDSNVTVHLGDGCDMPFANDTFTGAVCFTMLHHVPSEELQRELIREVYRVLRPGGTFAGTDSRDSWGMRLIHFKDTMVLVHPQVLRGWLAESGFADISVETKRTALRFHAKKPRST